MGESRNAMVHVIRTRSPIVGPAALLAYDPKVSLYSRRVWTVRRWSAANCGCTARLSHFGCRIGCLRVLLWSSRLSFCFC